MLTHPTHHNFYINNYPFQTEAMPPKAFKPPRPSKSAVTKSSKPKSTTARKSGGSTTSNPRSVTKPKPKAKPKEKGSNSFKVPRISGLPSLSPETEPDSEDDPFASQDPIEIASQDSQPGQEEEEDEERREGIPSDLLTRLLHENFKEEGTRLSKDASKAVGKYMETFVREALARAAFARAESDERNGRGGDGFLEVEDLEILAPQLLLDF
jgi:centromere protein X